MMPSRPTGLWAPGSKTRLALRISLGLFLVILSIAGTLTALPTGTAERSEPGSAPSCNSTTTNTMLSNPINPGVCAPAADNQTGIQPETVGADPYTDLSFPKTVVSSVNYLIGAGGVIHASPDNLTLYNSRVGLRLLGGSHPHDQLIGPMGAVIGSDLSWEVQAHGTGQWTSLVPMSNNFTIFGTNTTGTFVQRTMRVGNSSLSGVLQIEYVATSAGPIRWDLFFRPNSSGEYRLMYTWANITGVNWLSSTSKRYIVTYPTANYTFSWSDITSFVSVPLVSRGVFKLTVNLGNLTATSQIKLDPSLISTSTSADATGFTFQRKLFYDIRGGRYWVFYVDSYNVEYSNSTDGIHWFPPQVYPGCQCTYSPEVQVSVYVSGESVLVTQGTAASGDIYAGGSEYVWLIATVGTINGPKISWGASTNVYTLTETCPAGGPRCTFDLEMRYVNGIFAADGNSVFSANLYIQTSWTGSGVCRNGGSTESDVLVVYRNQPFIADCETSNVNLRSLLLPTDATGGVRVIYQSHTGSSVQIFSRSFYGTSSYQVVQATVNADLDSANPDTAYNTANPLYVSNSSSQQRIAVMGFPLTSIPTNGALASAQLTLQFGSLSGSGCCQMIIGSVIRQYTDSETWNQFFSAYKPIVAPYLVTPSFSGGSLTINIASINLSGGGLALLDDGSNTWVVPVYNRQSSFFPQLVYNYYCCMSAPESIDSNVLDGNGLSGVTDLNYGLHLLYQGKDGNVTYAYRLAGSSAWMYNSTVLPNTSSYPTLTIDYSTNYLYAFAVQGGTIVMKAKSPTHKWSDSSLISAVTNRQNPIDLASNLAVASNSNSTYLMLEWTEGTSSPYSVTFASIPVQTVWSPYAAPGDPWDGNGLAPYAQYFSNLQEYVSPSTGQLTVIQTDLSVPGRDGMNLAIARVYTESENFINGAYNYEPYPWAPLGNGWQLNFPWMSASTTTNPRFIHLWNGEGYMIPAAFWSGATAVYENHQGENFRFVRYSNNYIGLFDKSGIEYSFDPNHRLIEISNTLSPGISFLYFNYISPAYNSPILNVTDSIGRPYLFCYQNGFLHSINQTQLNATCNSSGLSLRGVVYQQNSNGSLVNVTDVGGRKTTYSYSAVSNPYDSPWVISRITYPTGWYTNYTYTPFNVGTQGVIYRTHLQLVQSPTTSIRQTGYAYTLAPSGQVSNSTVTSYNATYTSGAWTLVPVSYTVYNFSFTGVAWLIYDFRHVTISGEQQVFSVNGEIIKDTRILSDGQTPPHLGSYTNFYQYDLWGNQIYKHEMINPSAGWYHDSFNAYYNNGLSPGFYSFIESFRNNQGTAPDNQWRTSNSTAVWTVNNGAYTGAYVNGPYVNTFSWTNSSSADISVQARVLLNQQINNSAIVGLFVHYPGTGNGKWSMVLDTTTGPFLRFSDDSGGHETNTAAYCPLTVGTGTWSTFNLTIHGLLATGWASQDNNGPKCGTSSSPITATFSSTSPVAGAKNFGVFTGGFSASFANVTATTVSPSITTTGFSNSFFKSGAPTSIVHNALAGTATLQNGTASAPVETYYNYYSWGGLNQTKQLYQPSTGLQWLTTSRTYDSYGNLKTLMDARGNMTSYGYRLFYGYAYLTGVNRTLVPGGAVISQRYSYNYVSGALFSNVDGMGYNTTYFHDALPRLTQVNYPNGDYTAYTYNDANNYVDITNENGWKTRQIYDGLGRLSTTERFLNGNPYSNQSSTYNWLDKVSSTKDALGNISRYGYDALGRAINATFADNTVVKTYYNDTGSWVLTFNQNGNYSCRIVDRLGRLLTVIEVSDSACHSKLLNGYPYVTNYFYDELGNLRRIVSSNTQTTLYTYDNLNRLVRTSFADQTTRSYSYDNNGNIVSIIDQNNVRTSYLYDSLNRPTNVTYYGAHTERDNYTYDNNGNIVQTVNPNATINTVLEPRGRMTNEYYYINPTPCGSCGGGGGGGGSVAEGTLITLANGTAVPVQSLQAGMELLSYNVTTHQYATSTITRMAVVYTTNMLVIKTQDPLPLRVDNATAQKLWMMKADGSTGWFSVTELRVGDYLFNAISQQWRRVVSIEFASGGVHKMYDIYTTAPFDYLANNYLDPPKAPTGPSTPPGNVGASYSVAYTYNGENLIGIHYMSNFGVSYYYDGLGRLLNVTQGLPSYLAAFTYNKLDQITQIAYGNLLATTYQYDKLGRPTQITVGNPKKPSLSLGYTYNVTGTVASVTGSVNGAQVNEQYKYDALQRLVNATVVSGTSTTRLWYQYDSLGNRVAQGLNTTSTSLPSYKWITTKYGYNPANNELLNYTTSGSAVRYGYDANGNLLAQNQTSTSKWTYKWDVPGHLLSATNTTTVQGYYAYDATGRRVESKEGTVTTFYAYFGTETVYEQTATGTMNDYVFADGMLIAKRSSSSSTIVYYHPDGLGSTRLTTDSNGNTLFADSYQPFGQDNGKPSGSETYKFTGKPVGQTTGLYYDYQRWYDPSIGRFLSHDPLAGTLVDPQSLNPYVYVENLPTSLSDPSGMDSCGSLGWLVNLGCFGQAWNSQPTWAKYTEIGVGVTAAIILTAGIAAPEILVAVPPLLVGDISVGGTTVGVCEEDPITCSPPPPPPGPDGDPAPLPPSSTDIVDIPKGGFDEARAEGIFGNQPLQLAEGNYAHNVLTPGLADQGFTTQEALTSGNFPDAWNENGLVEIKPYHEGIDPFKEYGTQLTRYSNAFFDRFGYSPSVRLILYRYV